MILSAFAQGLAGGAGFGPVNVRLTNLALTAGRRDAVAFAAGAFAADSGLAVAGFALGVLSTSTDISGISGNGALRILSGLILASTLLWSSPPRRDPSTGDEAGHPLRQTWLAALMVMTSPLSWAVWFTFGASFAGQTNGAVSVAVMMSGDLLWFVVWLALTRRIGRSLPPRAVQLVNSAGRIAIGAISVLFIISGVRRL